MKMILVFSSLGYSIIAKIIKVKKVRYGKGNSQNRGCITIFTLTTLSPGASNFLFCLPSR